MAQGVLVPPGGGCDGNSVVSSNGVPPTVLLPVVLDFNVDRRGRIVRFLVARQIGQSRGRRPVLGAAVKVLVPTVLDVDADVVRVLVVAQAPAHHYPNRVAATDKTYNIRAPSRFTVGKSKGAFAPLPHEFVQFHLVNLAKVRVPVNCTDAVVAHFRPHG